MMVIIKAEHSNYKVVPGQAQVHSSIQLPENIWHEAVNE